MPSVSPVPAVSIVLPTYNRCQVLPRSVASVQAQSASDFELIIVDDCSTDGTENFVRACDDARIRYIKQPQNRGQSVARNTGVEAARAPLIAFQDSDDEWVQDKLAEQLEVMCRQPRVAMVYGDLLRIPISGAPFQMESPTLQRGAIVGRRAYGYATAELGIQTCLIRKEVLQRVGGFDPKLRCLEDLELFLRIIRRHEVVRLPRVLTLYYETDGVSRMTEHEHRARLFLLRRYWFNILLRRPRWLRRELNNLWHGRPLGSWT